MSTEDPMGDGIRSCLRCGCRFRTGRVVRGLCSGCGPPDTFEWPDDLVPPDGPFDLLPPARPTETVRPREELL